MALLLFQFDDTGLSVARPFWPCFAYSGASYGPCLWTLGRHRRMYWERGRGNRELSRERRHSWCPRRMFGMMG